VYWRRFPNREVTRSVIFKYLEGFTTDAGCIRL
jgi:hypothetical protein